MRPYRVVDDESASDVLHTPRRPRLRLISDQIAATPASGPVATPRPIRRPQPWTPRTDAEPQIPRRREHASPSMEAVPFSQTHRRMLAGFFLVCAVMVVSMVGYRMLSNVERVREPTVRPPEAPAVVAPVPAAPPQVEAQPSGVGPVVSEVRVLEPSYTVAPGDTLAIIARRHGTTIEALAAINNLENRNSLSVGQRLIIP